MMSKSHTPHAGSEQGTRRPLLRWTDGAAITREARSRGRSRDHSRDHSKDRSRVPARSWPARVFPCTQPGFHGCALCDISTPVSDLLRPCQRSLIAKALAALLWLDAPRLTFVIGQNAGARLVCWFVLVVVTLQFGAVVAFRVVASRRWLATLARLARSGDPSPERFTTAGLCCTGDPSLSRRLTGIRFNGSARGARARARAGAGIRVVTQTRSRLAGRDTHHAGPGEGCVG
jgi:hypothetical protein